MMLLLLLHWQGKPSIPLTLYILKYQIHVLYQISHLLHKWWERAYVATLPPSMAGDSRQITMAMVASLAHDVELNNFLFTINYIFPTGGANLLMLISGQPKS